MSTTLIIAFGCNLGAIAILIAIGLTFATRKEFMPYHGQALGKSWSDTEQPVQALAIMMMRGVAGYALALAVALLSILFIPFRQGASWALWAVPIAGIIGAAGSVVAMSYLAKHTPSKPPLALSAASGGLYFLGLCFSLL